MKRTLLTTAVALVVMASLVTADPVESPVASASHDVSTLGDPGPAAQPWDPQLVGPAARPSARTQARNAIVFLVDDMSDFPCAAVADFLPDSARWLSDHGTCYENAATATPVCCPARAQVQTGQLPHNNQVRTQNDADRLDAADTVQHDLGQAGLRTYGVGKNLNGVNAEAYFGVTARDTGFEDFDFWNSYRHGPGQFLMYDDAGAPYVPDTGLYSVETNGALLDDALDEYLATGERFYVYDSFFAPHKQGPGIAASSLPLPTPANATAAVPPFRYAPEPAARDKLALFEKPRRGRSYYERLWTARIRTLYDVDDQMAAAFRRLEAAGVLDETVVIFTSDNGYTDRGQANWEGKAIPYPAATNVPMLAWYPGRPPAVVARGVQLIDVPATLYDVLGVAPGHRLDGHSLLSPHQRKLGYGEFFAESNNLVWKESGRVSSWVRSWRLLRRGRWSYVVWYRADGRILARELYADRGMLHNVLWRGHRGPRPPAGLVGSLHSQLVRTSRCAGTVEQGAPNPCP